MGLSNFIDTMGGGNRLNPPSPSDVGANYGGMMQNWLGSQQSTYQNEADYQPKYAALGTSIVRDQAPGLMATLRNYNPGQTGLLDTLTSQAGAQLNLNGALDPATRRAVQQNTRSSQSARGLGQGPGDAAMETFYQTQTQEQRRQQNQNFATDMTKLNQGTYASPFALMAGVNKTPQITPSEMSNSMLGTVYNAQAAADTGNANMRAGGFNGMGSY